MSTFSTPDGRTLYPYSYAMLSFAGYFDGEKRDGFTFELLSDAEFVRSNMLNRGAVNVEIGRAESIERDDEAGFPAFRAWVNAMDNCDTARRIGAKIVVLRCRA